MVTGMRMGWGMRAGWVVLALLAVGCGGGGATPSRPAGEGGAAGANVSPPDSGASPAGGKGVAGGPATGEPGAVGKKGTIGYSALTLTNPFFKVIADTMQAEARRQGYEVLVLSAERDVKVQADHVQEFLVKGVSAIVLNPCDSASIGPAIAAANAAGVPVFTNDIKYVGSEGKVVCHVATDNLQGGRLAGEAMVQLLAGTGGQVAILHFPQAESCQLRVQGFLEVLTRHNEAGTGDKIEVVATLDGGGVRDEGFKAAKDTIEANPDLAAIFAINDPSALGARAALEGVGKAEQVKIIAFDGQLVGKQAILEGKIVCDPIQFPDRIGRVTIEQIVKHFGGDEVEAEILIPSELYYRADAQRDPELTGGKDPVP